MKTGFREMEAIDDFDKGDLHSMVGVKAILEWVEMNLRQNMDLVSAHLGWYNKIS